MRTAAAAFAGALVTFIVMTSIQQTNIEHRVQVIDRGERLVDIDLQQLEQRIAGIDAELDDECIRMIHRVTGDPEQGIRNYVDRYYQGDACKAAQEAWSGEW